MSTNSHNATSGKCFFGVLRRLLCSSSLQTYPSDNYLSELDKIDFNQPKKALKTEDQENQPAATPGIVARLMGLESMPDINWAPKQRTTLDSIMRSRSVSCVDYLPNFDLTQQSLHRRVRTSVSFREVPTSLHQQNRDFFVLCFDKVYEVRSNGKVGMREAKEKKGVRSKKDGDSIIRERNLGKKRENQENSKKSCGRKESSKRVEENVTIHKRKDVYRKPNAYLKGKSPLKPVNHKEVSVPFKYTKQRKKAESRCKSVNSLASTSGPKELISRKVEKFKKPSQDFVSKWKADNQEHRAIHKKAKKPLTADLEGDYYAKILVHVFRLTEEETRVSNWPLIAREVFEFGDFEEICVKFGEEILQLLLSQIVDELMP